MKSFTFYFSLFMFAMGASVFTQASDDGTAEKTMDLKRGKIQFLMCRSCHSLEKDGAHRVGPNLNGLFGANAGSKEGFNYSEAIKAKNIVWSRENLDKFITKPSDYVPGTIMAFAGVQNEKSRSALLDYLECNTQQSADQGPEGCAN